MLITAREIDILQNVAGSGVIRCSGCDELIVGECVGGAQDIDEEGDEVVYRSFAPCPHCGWENTTITY